MCTTNFDSPKFVCPRIAVLHKSKFWHSLSVHCRSGPHVFAQCIDRLCCHDLLRGHDSYYLRPIVVDARLFELMAYGVHYPGRPTARRTGVHPNGHLSGENGAQIEICFQLPVRKLDFTDQIIIIPSGFSLSIAATLVRRK